MKQVIQNLRSGVLELLEVPAPKVSSGNLLLQTTASLISAGTERSLVEFSKASLVNKARQNPDRVRQVLDKIKSDGLLPTLEAVFSKLDEPLPLGYCNAARVIEIGDRVTDYSVGDRVASNAPHAEIINQPVNLCAKIPDNVSDTQAAFTPVASIALQGIRLSKPEIGETFVVFGLGLVGLLATQILIANGVKVIAVDLDTSKLKLAEQFGAHPINPTETADVVTTVLSLTSHRGADGVLITASAKKDSIVKQSAQMSRKRGRIVLVGVVNLQLDRADFYEKELSFQVSCSYGPGRYDENYENRGIDYPLGLVRFTEQRNFETVLQLMSRGLLQIDPLVTHSLPHAEASAAYQLLSDDRSQIGIVFTYPEQDLQLHRTIQISTEHTKSKPSSITGQQVVVGVIGSGNFARRGLIPQLVKTDAKLESVASATGVSATHTARKFGFAKSTSDYQTILDDKDINTVFITTRNGSHAAMICEALRAGKHVFVEKPLAINEEQLANVRAAYEETSDQHLMVGFNRRFAPHSQNIVELLENRTGPIVANFTINAGYIPSDDWQFDPIVGGGRMIGEGCHWIDLLCFYTQSTITTVTATKVGSRANTETRNDKMIVTLSFADGSVGNLTYLANGHRSFPKESLELFCDGCVLQLDNFRKMFVYGWSNFYKMKLSRQDKGHHEEIQQFISRIAEGGPPLIEIQQLYNVTEATFAAEIAAEQDIVVKLPLI